ncbi:unnamed protein product [Chrysoparadoxa australica]
MVEVRTVLSRHVDAEHSKFLGGDLEHTHLVKGLDYALLVKMREEEAHKGVHDEEAELDEALETAEEKAKRNKLEEERNKVEVTTFTGKTIQSVWKVIQGEARGDVIDFSRVAYEYEIGDGADLTLPSIPTIVARSKTEDAVQDEADRYMNYQVDEGLLQRLRDTMSLFKEGKHGKLKRIKKRQRGSNGTAARGSGSTSKQAAVLAPKISSIFDDVTEKYVPDELREEVPAPAKSSADDGATPGAGSGSKVKKSRWGVAPAAAEKDGEKKREKLAQGTYFAGLTKDGKAATESILVAPSRDEINKSIRNAAGKGKAAPPTKVVPEKKDPKIIDRDIFGGGKKGKASDRGHAMDKATTEYGESFDYDFADDFEYEKMKNKQKNMPSLKKEGSDAGKTEKKGRRERPKGGKEVE